MLSLYRTLFGVSDGLVDRSVRVADAVVDVAVRPDRRRIPRTAGPDGATDGPLRGLLGLVKAPEHLSCLRIQRVRNATVQLSGGREVGDAVNLRSDVEPLACLLGEVGGPPQLLAGLGLDREGVCRALPVQDTVHERHSVRALADRLAIQDRGATAIVDLVRPLHFAGGGVDGKDVVSEILEVHRVIGAEDRCIRIEALGPVTGERHRPRDVQLMDVRGADLAGDRPGSAHWRWATTRYSPRRRSKVTWLSHWRSWSWGWTSCWQRYSLSWSTWSSICCCRHNRQR